MGHGRRTSGIGERDWRRAMELKMESRHNTKQWVWEVGGRGREGLAVRARSLPKAGPS